MEIPNKIAAERTHRLDNATMRTGKVVNIGRGNDGELKLGACGAAANFKLRLRINYNNSYGCCEKPPALNTPVALMAMLRG